LEDKKWPFEDFLSDLRSGGLGYIYIYLLMFLCLNFRSRPNLTSFERFQLLIRKQSLYEEDDKVVDTLLKAMINEEIVHIEQKEGGTQLKLIMDFESNGQAMFKPMR